MSLPFVTLTCIMLLMPKGYSYHSAPATISATQATTVTLSKAVRIQDISLTVEQGGEPATYTLTTANISQLRTTLNNIGTDVSDFETNYLKSSEKFKDYTNAPTSLSNGSNIYFYALHTSPTTTKGTFRYYATPSATNDTDFVGDTFTHYYLGTQQIIGNTDADAALFKVAYDRANAQFIAKAANDCPAGEYEVKFGMLRKYDSKYYVGFFNIAITVTEKESSSVTKVLEKDNTLANEVIYDLSGRRVENPVKGIYVVKGKKVWVK